MWQPRWALVGDSIQAWVLESGNTVGLANKLTASRIPDLTNVSIQNLSKPGMRLAKGQDTSLMVFKPSTIDEISGPFGINGVICTLGTNDYSNPNVTTVDFFHALNALIEYVKPLNIPLVFVSPIWRASMGGVQKYDGSVQTLADFRNTINWIVSMVPASQKVYHIDGNNAPVKDASFFGDGLHLNGKGHIAFGDWLTTQMKSKGLWQ